MHSSLIQEGWERGKYRKRSEREGEREEGGRERGMERDGNFLKRFYFNTVMLSFKDQYIYT